MGSVEDISEESSDKKAPEEPRIPRRLYRDTALLGASGIVFMLIMLASLSGFSGGIPVTMLLVAALYLGQQVYDIIFVRDNVANFMHIVGGVCGTVFGYVNAGPRRKRRK